MRRFGSVVDGADRAPQARRSGFPCLERRQIFLDRIGRTGAWSRAEGDQRLRRMHRTKLRMRGGAVIALDEALDDQLPIGRGWIGLRMRDLPVGETVEIEIGCKIRE